MFTALQMLIFAKIIFYMVIDMKSEKEKAQVGELYDANNDPGLLSERDLCKKSMF